MAYTCQNCGVSADTPNNLCDPINEEIGNKFCGNSADQVCNDTLGTMKYSCDTCGSIAADASHLCSPSRMR